MSHREEVLVEQTHRPELPNVGVNRWEAHQLEIEYLHTLAPNLE